MFSEPAFLWFVPSEGNDAHTILVKAQSNLLRSIINGVKVQLFCTVSEVKGEKHLCLALRVYDDAAHPCLIFKVQTHKEEHLAFWEILKRKSSPVFLFDELCHCVAWTKSQFAEEGISEISRLIDSPETLYTGKFNENTLFSMNCLNFTLDPSQRIEGSKAIEIIDMEIDLKQFETWEINSYGVFESHKFEITADEGDGFEQRIWTAFESIFLFGVYRSPQFQKGEKELELTDILGLSDDNLILVEAKAMSIFTGNAEKDIDRKVRNLQKQIDTALKQLEGATKRIKKGSQVLKKKVGKFDNSDRRISFNENQLSAPHAVMIVSELLPFGDWSGYFQKCLQLSRKNQALFQIIDLPELMKIIFASNKATDDVETRANAFDHFLTKRFDAFVESKNVFIKVKFD